MSLQATTTNASPAVLLADRRLLLTLLLEALAEKGRTVLLPVGCNGFDDWLLDAINVERLARQIKVGGNLDLIHACTGSTSLAVHSPSPGGLDLPPVVDFKDMSIGPRLVVEDPRVPALRLKSLGQMALDEVQLKELAYTIFVGCCAASASPNVMHGIRAQMEVTEARSAELQRVFALARQQGVTSLTNLEMHAKLLQVVRPAAFDCFKNFVRWRETVSSTVWLVLRQATRDSWAPTPGPGSEAASARMLLARLAGALRRMDVRDADEYDEREYSEAAGAAVDAARQLAAHCTAGWAFPWALRARLAELLLRGVFDALEEGKLVGHSAELLGLLEARVWPELGVTKDVHSALHAWVHYRQFGVSREPRLLEAAAAILREARPLPTPPSTPPSSARSGAGAAPLVITAEEADAAFPAEVMACVCDSARAVLSDYRANASDPRELKGLLGVLEAAARVCDLERGLPAALEACVRSSVEAEFNRQADEVWANTSNEDDRVALLLAASKRLLEEEYARFSPLLLQTLPEARMAAGAEVHEIMGAKFLPWLISVTGLTKSALEIIRAAVALEDGISVECRERPLAPWGTMDRLSPLLYTWAQGQVGMLAAWMERSTGAEDWGRLTRQRSGCARSAVETLKMVTDTLEALFDMKLAVPPGVVRCLVEGADSALGRYAAFAALDVGSAEALIPTRPPLTRYKREIAVAAEEADNAAAVDVQARAGGVGGRLRGVKGRLESAMSGSWLSPLGSTEDEARIMYTPLPTLVVRANSVQHVEDALPGLRAMVIERWEGERLVSAKKNEGAAAYEWVSGMFDSASKSITDAREQLCRFIAVRLVYGDMRELIFERLYRFRVAVSRLEPVLQEVDRQLGEICAQAHDALPPRLARATLIALAAAVRQVLTDGGPYRLFTPDDVDMLESDLAALKAMFYAEGDGLGAAETDAACRGVGDLLDVMRLDTGTIIATLKQYTGRPGGGRHAATDPDILLRVLCHRADHAASKYLKDKHKVSKKLPNVVAASVSQLGSTVGKASGGLLRKASISKK